jgi:hypothetical protein
MSRLTNDKYKKPKVSYTELLTQDEIKEKLNDYTKVQTINDVMLGSHVRYISKDSEGIFQFRMGGTLLNKKGLPAYVVLGNGAKTWSVQVDQTIFFSKLTTEQLRAEYQILLDEKDEEIEEKDKQIKQLTLLTKDLLKEIKTLKKK